MPQSERNRPGVVAPGSGRLAIPRFWRCPFAAVTGGAVFALAAGLGSAAQPPPMPIRVALVILLALLVPAGLHRLGQFAETRGWIYYHSARTIGLGTGVVLDLDFWVTGRNQSIENLRMASQGLGQRLEAGGQAGDDPDPDKATTRFEPPLGAAAAAYRAGPDQVTPSAAMARCNSSRV